MVRFEINVVTSASDLSFGIRSNWEWSFKGVVERRLCGVVERRLCGVVERRLCGVVWWEEDCSGGMCCESEVLCGLVEECIGD